MASIAEIARYAGVSVEGVLRVINNETVSEDVEQRVQETIAVHGFPHRTSSASAVEPPLDEQHESSASDVQRMEAVLERAREQLSETVGQAAANLESRLPEGVGSAVYDAVHIEVAPVARQVQAVGDFFEHLLRRVEQVQGAIRKERSERVEDLALLVDLVTTSWRNVDRRLGRIERKLERLETQPREDLVPGILRTEERRKRPHPR